MTLVCASCPPFLVGALYVQIQESIGLKPQQLASAVCGFYAVGAIASPTAARLVARIGMASAMRCTCLATSGGIGLLTFVANANSVVLIVSLLGLPAAAMQPVANALLSTICETDERRIAFGLAQAAIPASTLMAGTLLLAVAGGMDWRSAMGVPASIGILAQAAVPPREKVPAAPSDGEVPAQSPAIRPSGEPRSDAQPGPSRSTSAIFFTACALAAASCSGLPTFTAVTAHAHGYASGSASTLQISSSALCMVVRVLSTRWAPLAGRRMISVTGAFLLIGSGGLFALGSSSSLAFPVGIMLAYGFGWGWTGLLNLGAVSMYPRDIPKISGVTAGGIFLGAAAGPPAFSALYNAQSLGAAWSASGLCALVGGIVVIAGIGRRAASPHVRWTG